MFFVIFLKRPNFHRITHSGTFPPKRSKFLRISQSGTFPMKPSNQSCQISH
ncbi:MAG: hypothetical protein Q8881_03145 [Sweet potato little leaf phytoplasma]|nr:hypothetical protein [Sweet potato little leaf phytoplasma]